LLSVGINSYRTESNWLFCLDNQIVT